MARIFQKAQDTILFQDSIKQSIKALRTLLPTTPRKTQRVVAYSKPPTDLKQLLEPCLPSFSPVCRLSEELPSDLQSDHHDPVLLPAARDDSFGAEGIELFGAGGCHPLNDISFRSTVLVRHLPSSRDVRGVNPSHSPLDTVGTDVGSWTDDDNFVKQYPVKPLPISPVDMWLEGVFDNMSFEQLQREDASDGTFISPQTQKPSGLFGDNLRKIPKFTDILAASGMRRRPTIGKAIVDYTVPPPTRATSKEPFTSTSMKLSQILRKHHPSEDNTTQTTTSRSSSGKLGIRRLQQGSEETTNNDKVEPLCISRIRISPLKDADVLEVAPLTPEVERYRKGDGPRKPRCASYYDKDVIKCQDAMMAELE